MDTCKQDDEKICMANFNCKNCTLSPEGRQQEMKIMYHSTKKIEIYITNYGEFNIRTFKDKIIKLLDEGMTENKSMLYAVNEAK